MKLVLPNFYMVSYRIGTMYSMGIISFVFCFDSQIFHQTKNNTTSGTIDCSPYYNASTYSSSCDRSLGIHLSMEFLTFSAQTQRNHFGLQLFRYLYIVKSSNINIASNDLIFTYFSPVLQIYGVTKRCCERESKRLVSYNRHNYSTTRTVRSSVTASLIVASVITMNSFMKNSV